MTLLRAMLALPCYAWCAWLLRQYHPSARQYLHYSLQAGRHARTLAAFMRGGL